MAIIGAIGSIVSGIAAFSQAQYQAAVAKANEKQAKLNAELSMNIAQKDAEDLGTQAKGQMGELVAAQGASGISLSSPSAVRGRKWMSAVGYQDQTRRTEQGQREFANYRTQANVYAAEAKAAKMSGMFSLIGGFINAAGSMVGSAQPSAQSPGYMPVSQTRNMYQTGQAMIGLPAYG
jgi:hypothetical protein